MTDVGGPTAARAPRVSVNVGYAVLGRAYMALTQFGILLVVTRLGTPEDVAALSLAAAVVTPLFFLTSMGMREAHTVDDLKHATQADYVALRLLLACAAVAVSGAIAFAYYGGKPAVLWATIAFSVVKFFGAQLSLNHGIFQRAERLDYVARSSLGRGTFGFAAFALVFWLSRDLPVAMLAEAAAWGVSNLVVDRPKLQRIGGWTGVSDLRLAAPGRMLKLALWLLPLAGALFLMRAAFSAPPLVLERHVDLATVGVFGAIAHLHSAMSMVANTFGSASSARMRKYYRKGKRRGYLRLALSLSAVATTLGALAVLIAAAFGDELLALVFGPAYARGDVLVVVMLASAIGIAAAPIVAAINAAQAFRRRLIVSASGFAVAVVAAILLVPGFGILGAAWAMVLMTSTQTLLNLAFFVMVLRRIPPLSQSEEA